MANVILQAQSYPKKKKGISRKNTFCCVELMDRLHFLTTVTSY